MLRGCLLARGILEVNHATLHVAHVDKREAFVEEDFGRVQFEFES